MIIVRIWEGLGNQLFQYAYAKALSLRTNHKILLDVKHANRGDFAGEISGTRRSTKLDKYKISLEIYDGEVCIEDLPRIVDGNNNLNCLDSLYIPEDGSYISASCINSLYFEEYWTTIKNDFILKETPKVSSNLAQIMRDFSTISVHIRLTDYVGLSDNVCRQIYYDLAFKYIDKYVDNPFYLIFTDDIEAAKKIYNMPFDSYWISTEKLADYEEMWLMSQCNHNIIAASTFSYWGALLNENDDKIVIAPRKWEVKESYKENWVVM